ncbi:collagenase-like PrtC family protease [Azospirillum fermentarium]|uniref:ubiquinone anaerobic biosynthesis protein UbiV n=1 Tax=Azospirillum fermentarium TaxID=1233114 RepID=UPI002226F874|nr:U32 family peptidase [Azospirillum fermentarium]MCW2248994.1 collagenase-like PrtC family protease [Azospirillum fermentarium]
MTKAELSLGPVLFNWAPEVWRDFYVRIADEAPVETVFLGEVVCAKRAPFIAAHLPAVLERLAAAGKRVVLSTPILVTTERERQAVRDLAATDAALVEANDLGSLPLLAGRPHAVGPFVNVYNEGTLAWLARRGAVMVSLPGELTRPAVAALAKAAAPLGVELEVQVSGRLPLAISARCYHARAHGLHKDGCQFVCANDPDGLDVTTLDGTPFLAVNGTQTLSHTHTALVAELDDLQTLGIRRFRLSPQSGDMVAVARLFRGLLDGHIATAEALARLKSLLGAEAALSNGFYHDRAGVAFAG